MSSKKRRPGRPPDRLVEAVRQRRAEKRAQEDPHAHFVASAVYEAVKVWREEDGPASVMAPITVGSEFAAPLVAKQLDLDPTDEALVTDMAAFLAFSYMDRIANLTREDFERWKETADARENAAAAAARENGVTP